MYRVTEEELATLNSELPNVSIGFMFFAAGCAVAFGTTAWGSDIKPDSAGDFRSLFWASVFCFAVALLWSASGVIRRRMVIRRVRRRDKGDGNSGWFNRLRRRLRETSPPAVAGPADQ